MGARVWTLALLQLTYRSAMTVTSLEQVQPHVWRQDTGVLASWPGWWVAKDGKTHPMWSDLGALAGRPCTLGLPWSPLRPHHPWSSARPDLASVWICLWVEGPLRGDRIHGSGLPLHGSQCFSLKILRYTKSPCWGSWRGVPSPTSYLKKSWGTDSEGLDDVVLGWRD